MPTPLPIDAIKEDFLNALNTHQTLVLTAPPGAGKSTRLPLWLLDVQPLSGKKVYILQPRRIAAKNIACYLAEQLGETVGKTIGYRLRNDTKVSAETRIEVITEGILTQIIQKDPELTDCGMIILDEFHERSLHADLAFALSRDIQQGLRDDLIIMLMSATLVEEGLLAQLPDAIALKSEGRSYPVDISYRPPGNAREWREHALQVIKQCANTHRGSILVFLPGVADIRYLEQQLTGLADNVLLCPLYGELSLRQQQQAIAPAPKGMNKLVLATNIAETSLTIEGVNLVIDAGLEKVAIYDQQNLSNRLVQQMTAKSSCIQRAGRAGRLMAGQCIRLFSQENFDRRVEQGVSEIQQADILPLLIEAAKWGVTELKQLALLELPAANKELASWHELQALKLVDGHCRLTPQGHEISKYSCHPRYARMLAGTKSLEEKHQVSYLTLFACLLSALLEERDIFTAEQARFDVDISHRVAGLKNNHPRIKASKQRIFMQTQRLAKQARLPTSLQLSDKSLDALPLQYCGTLLALAYPERIAKLRHNDGEFICQNGKGVKLNLEDAMAGEDYIVAVQLHQYQHTLYARMAAKVELNTLLAWDIVTLGRYEHLAYDNQKDRILACEQQKLGAIIVSEKPLSRENNTEQVASLWAEQVRKRGLDWLNWREADLALLARWRWLNLYQSQLDFPDVSPDGLMAKLDTWFVPFVGQVKSKAQLDKCDFSAMLTSLLDYQQQQDLLELAPSHFIGPTGRRCPIRYGEEKSPTVSLPMQEVYGLAESPAIGSKGSRVSLILELLSPAQRPIQITQDLSGFWQGSYKAVQKDMKSRYPKHYWPDDPANAQATNKTKRHIKG